MRRMNAVVLGGGNVDERFEGYPVGASKALIPLQGKPCVQHVLEALRGTPAVERIALVGPQEVLEHPAAALAEVKIAEAGGIVSKLAAAAEALGSDCKLLMVTCDIPLATGESFGEVIEACPEECAVFHPLVERSAAERGFPDHKWLFIKLDGREVVTTNVVIFDAEWLVRRRGLAEEVEKLRQHPVRFALRWGLGFLVRYELGALKLGYCEGLFSKLLGAPCRGMVCGHTGLAMDLDRPEDVPMMERWLAQHDPAQ